MPDYARDLARLRAQLAEVREVSLREIQAQAALFEAAKPVLLAAGELVDTPWNKAPDEDKEPEAHAAYVELAEAVRTWRDRLRPAAADEESR